MSKFTGVYISVACLCLSVLKAQGSVLTRNASNVFLSYNEGNSHSVYDACAWKGPGTLSFLFNTRKHNTFLAYQDDGTYSNFDLFLVEGKIRARVNFDKCTWEQLIIEGNYSDSRWHRVRLTRSLSNVTLTVDGCHSQSIVCDISSPERERWHALYIGSIPLHITMNSLANPGIFQQAIASGFQGCIGHVIQSVTGKSPKALPLQSSEGTGQICDSSCAFGGKCSHHTDDVTGKECECPGYGIQELMCKRPVSTAHTIKTSFSSGFNSTHVSPIKVTPALFSASQVRVLSTATSSSNVVKTSSRTQSVSVRVHAQYVDVGVLHQESSEAGNSSFSNQHGPVPVRSSSVSQVSPPPSPSTVVGFGSSSVNNEVAAMVRKSSSVCIAGSCVALNLALIATFQNFMNQ